MSDALLFFFPARLKAQPAFKRNLAMPCIRRPRRNQHIASITNKCEPEPHCTARLGGKADDTCVKEQVYLRRVSMCKFQCATCQNSHSFQFGR